MMWFVLVASVVALAEGAQYANLAACQSACVGTRDACVTRASGQFDCGCQAGYFRDEGVCDEECDNLYWSLFTYGTCTDPISESGFCQRTCGWRVRVWTTVFIIVSFVAAVATLIFILPICIATCKACLTVNKESKHRKKQQKQASEVNNQAYDQSTIGGGQMVKAQQANMYNPYMYGNWPYYAR